jgi:hypothetical protein
LVLIWGCHNPNSPCKFKLNSLSPFLTLLELTIKGVLRHIWVELQEAQCLEKSPCGWHQCPHWWGNSSQEKRSFFGGAVEGPASCSSHFLWFLMLPVLAAACCSHLLCSASPGWLCFAIDYDLQITASPFLDFSRKGVSVTLYYRNHTVKTTLLLRIWGVCFVLTFLFTDRCGTDLKNDCEGKKLVLLSLHRNLLLTYWNYSFPSRKALYWTH